MRKKSRKSQPSSTDRSATTDVVTQLEVAFRNPGAAAIGALIGGLIPWFGRTLAHGEIQSAWSAGNHPLAMAMILVVLGCGCFSGLSVYKFGHAAFGDARKALGFVLALEGVMLVSHGATSAVALAVLVLINAVANGAVIALARDATRRRQEADARRAASRVRTRRGTRTETAPSPHTAHAPVVTHPAVPHPARAPGHAFVPSVWRHPPFDAAIDAKIVSAERLLA
jgi:hypothetical protein